MFNKYFISLVFCLSSLCPTHSASMLKKSMSMPDLTRSISAISVSDLKTGLTKSVTSVTTKAVIDALKSEEGKAAVLAIAKTLLGGAAGAAADMANKAKEEAERMANIAKDEAKGIIKQVLDAFKKTLNQIPMGGSAIVTALEQAMKAADL